ncbi:hypothetical protein TNCV_4882451 [Trichonephila clavipes]|nr:hypothetical protein TNCV_4882451 [Trichonephila clavipes]
MPEKIFEIELGHGSEGKREIALNRRPFENIDAFNQSFGLVKIGARLCRPLQSGPSKPVLRMSFPDDSIQNVGEPDSRKPFSPTSSEHSPQWMDYSQDVSNAFLGGLWRGVTVEEFNASGSQNMIFVREEATTILFDVSQQTTSALSSGVMENIRGSLQNKILGPKADLAKVSDRFWAP